MIKPSQIYNNIKPLNLSKNATKAIEVLGNFSTPGQRFVLGGSAFFLQSFIDLRNKKVDKETRTLNASRSMGRAVVGTVTGVILRHGLITMTEKNVKDAPKTFLEKFVSCDAMKTKNYATKEVFNKALKNYSKAWGTVLALGVMLFTNFLVDVPLTHKLSKVINKNFFQKNKNKEGEVQK